MENDEIKRPTGMVHNMPNPAGRPPRFKKASELWDKFVQYCDFVDANPWQVKTASNALDSRGEKQNGNYLRQNVEVRQRAYTLYGFCAYAGIHYKWGIFRKNYCEKEGFAQVMDQIENVVLAYQVDGALIHQFDSGLVARLNGFADKQQMELTGKDGEDFKWPKLTIDDIETLKKQNGL